MTSIDELITIMARLRDPETGCPWDLEQSFSTIAPYTLEEAYEVADAIERGDMGELKGELGDLLFQVVFHARMAEESAQFDFGEVVQGICDKMVRRHPHVFGESTVGSAEEQTRAWEAHKARERSHHNGALDGVARALPALVRAEKLQRRAARVGFDWPDISGPLDKCHEELDEITLALAEGSDEDRRHELGDLLFACVNLARHAGVDAEQALRSANDRFARRFRHMESAAEAAGESLADLGLEELDTFWEAAKQALG
ncbi:MAG: nucleoside triphosphate pyrophosphohydrolase [Pseudomonadota bacterium]